MTLTTPPESEHLLAAAIAQEQFLSPGDALRRAIDLLAVEQEVLPATNLGPLPNWAKAFRDWATGRRSTGSVVEADRESIYDSHRL